MGSRWPGPSRCSAGRMRPGGRSWLLCSARRRRPPSCRCRRCCPGLARRRCRSPGTGRGADVGPVTGVGVPGHWEAAVARDHQPEPDQSQVGALLFGLAAALRDPRFLVRGGDEGGEVGHVKGDGGDVHTGDVDRRSAIAGLIYSSPARVTASIASQNRRWSNADAAILVNRSAAVVRHQSAMPLSGVGRPAGSVPPTPGRCPVRSAHSGSDRSRHR